MITILLGSEKAIRRRCQYLHASSNHSILLHAVTTENGRRFVRHNANLRDLLAKLRRHVGDEAFERIVSHHRPAAAFLLDRVYDTLSSDERSAYERMASAITSQTSHNWFTSSFLIAAWAELFTEFLGHRPTRLIVPEIQVTAPGFIEVVKKILLREPPPELELVVGFKREEPNVAPDDDGILWDFVVFRNLRQSLSSFEGAVVCDVEDLEDEGAPDEHSTTWFDVDPWDSDADAKLFSALTSPECDRETVREARDLLERMFGAYDFRSALQLGSRLLAHETSMTAVERSYVHTAVAICAHNRQFASSGGNEKFNAFVERHLRSAFEVERDPILRSVISYRLATTLARRRKDAGTAVACVNQSLDELREAFQPSRQRAYYEAWLFNIRAYANMLLRDYRQSAHDVETAFELTERYWNYRDDATPDEIYSAQLFAGNRATLAIYGHDDEALDEWFTKGTGTFERHWGSVGRRYVRYLRIEMAKRKLDFATAIQAGLEGLADARQEKSAEYQDIYRMNLADLYFRMGDLASVMALLHESLAAYEKLREVRRRFPATLFLAAAEARAGNLMVADALYEQILQTLGPHADRSMMADILSAKAVLAARQNGVDAAEAAMDEAIGLAVDSGERDTLLLVARRTGEAFALLGEHEQARDAYLRAADIGSVVPEGAHNPPAGDMARVWLGLYECEGRPEYLESLLRELPAALADDADLWWELPSILRLLCGRGLTALLEANAPELDILRRAASQRPDCEELLASLPLAKGPWAARADGAISSETIPAEV